MNTVKTLPTKDENIKNSKKFEFNFESFKQHMLFMNSIPYPSKRVKGTTIYKYYFRSYDRLQF